MGLVGSDRTFVRWLALFLVGIVLFQPLALPLHEYNLRQSGYTLVRGPFGASSPAGNPGRRFAGDKNFYNISNCTVHFLLQTLQQFRELLVGGLIFAGLYRFLQSAVDRSIFVRKDEFLSELILRAPPFPPARTV
jgi:hypothetical protein